MQANAGFDNPSSDRAKDDLDRWRFALDIADVITNTPLSWSVRIGLFGTWGAGKTTIFKYIGDLFESEGDIVIYFTPSFESDFSNAAGALGSVLVEELDKHGFVVENSIKRWFRKHKFWKSQSTTKVIEASSEFTKGGKVISAGLGMVSLWLKHSATEIERLCQQFPQKRFIVLIDDLDRTTPELLPKFLLSLREVLDLPRFAFLLAFDEGIVANALATRNPEWNGGQDFLEKILDFRFLIPPIESNGKRKLLERALLENAAFVPLTSISEVEELIPSNPRELKSLVRGIRSIEPVVNRHKPDEFSWTDVWLVQLLRQESPLLLQLLGKQQTFSETVGMSYSFKKSYATRGHNTPPIEDPTEPLLDEANVAEAARDRIRLLLEAMRARASSQLHYVLNWSLRPPAVTWREFFGILQDWREDGTPAKLEKLMLRHAAERSDAPERVQQELIEALSLRIGELLDQSTRLTEVGDLGSKYEEVAELQSAVRTFFDIPGMLNPDRFKTFYQSAQYWIAVRRNQIEINARNAERDDLLRLAGRLTGDQALAVFEVMQPWVTRSVDMPFEDGGARLALRSAIAAVLRETVETRLVRLFSEGESIKKFEEKGRYLAYKGLLFGEAGRWSPVVRSTMLQAIQGPGDPEVIYSNAEAMSRLWIEALNFRHADISASSVQVLINDVELVKAVWSTLLVRELLPRGCVRLIALRQKLLESSVPEEVLPLDPQLEAQMQYFNEHQNEIMNSL